MALRIGGSRVVSMWMIATAAASIVAMVGGGGLYQLAAFNPDRIWHGQVWRLLTWVFVEVGPWSMAITLACLYKFGGDLAPRWGERRLRRFLLQIVIGASIAGAVLALLSDVAWNAQRCGGVLVTDVLIIAWARQYPSYAINLFGFLQLGGQRLIGFTVGITALLALSSNPIVMTPELVACLAATLYPERWLSRL